MADKLKILAVIPARGGSKGIPGKNVKPLAGKPLIAWTIEEAKKSKYISKLIVSSEDDTIINIAKEYGADVPFVRPQMLAMDETPGIQPIKHAIQYYFAQMITFDYVICLQCTSPMRTVEDIDNAIELCISSNADSLISVCETEHNPHWMVNVGRDGIISRFIEGDMTFCRRQDLPKVYRLNGAIYIARPELVLGTNGWIAQNTKAFVMDQEHSIDIDTALDFSLAELILVS